MTPEILTIVVTYNAMKWLDRCLGSLIQSEVPTDIMIIDNGSVDGTCEYISRNHPNVRLVRSDENLGFGQANNEGLRYALEHQYRYVYLMNQDAWICKDTLGALVSAMESDSTIGILSPMQMTASGDRPDPRFAKWCPEKALMEYASSEDNGGEVYEIPFVMAAHWMISRECLQKTGGFSPSFPHYGEDDNFIHRALYHGFRCGICSGAGAVHDRDQRPMTKLQSMKLKCIASVVKISNPLNCLAWRLVRQPLELIAIAVRYASPYVLGEMFRMIGRYPELIRNRKISKGLCPFL